MCVDDVILGRLPPEGQNPTSPTEYLIRQADHADISTIEFALSRAILERESPSKDGDRVTLPIEGKRQIPNM